MDSYVHYLEGHGARVVPLINGEPKEVTLEKLSKLNGVLFPGGEGNFVEFGQLIYSTIKEYNDNGTFYPLWSTCLGYEDLVGYAASAGRNVIQPYPVYGFNLPLEFMVNPK